MMNHKAKRFLDKTTKLFLGFALTLTGLFGGHISYVYASDKPQEKATDSPIADHVTMEDWKNYFGYQNGSSTEHAGRIWTDKSVIADPVFQVPDANNITIRKDRENDLLVALSALSSNKEIIGQSAIPVDVVFVLDMSYSMVENNAGAGGRDINRVQDMVDALNPAMRTLLENEDLNDSNRIGIVSYHTDATQILPLNTYRIEQNENYINHNERNNQISVNKRSMQYKNASGRWVNASGLSTGSSGTGMATNIQSGILAASDMLESANDKEIDGIKRIPIIVVMSDGVPTTASPDFVDMNNGRNLSSDSGRLSNPRVGFFTQLTGQYHKEFIEEAYGRNALLYTLGLAVNDDGEAVLNPSNMPQDNSYRNTFERYWNTFSNASVDNNYQLEGANYRKYADVETYRYNDQYFASEDGGLDNAFDDIVQQIIIQSRYYPTDNDTLQEQQNLTGYVEMIDEIGQFMEVKSMKGIVVGGLQFTGAEFAEAIVHHNGDYGTSSGDNFVWSVQERLELEDIQTVRDLIADAYHDGQIAFDDATGTFSNYIGWYADKDGKYLGFAKKDMSNLSEYPTAVKFNRSYAYYGYSAGTYEDADLMYLTVRIEEDIENHDQRVVYKIPSSLVPLIKYEADVQGNNVDDVDTGTISRSNATPVQLFYEVGLRDEVNEFTVKSIVGDTYPYVDADDEDLYYFYSNAWTNQTTPKTNAKFTPNLQNEFYYFTKNTKIYTDASCETPLMSKPVAGRTYYYQKNIFDFNDSTASGNDVPATIRHIGMRVPEGSLVSEDGNVYYDVDDNGEYYIKINTPKKDLEPYRGVKDPNTTGTANFYINPSVVYRPDAADDTEKVDISVQLGNNGRVALEQQEGIMIAKVFNEINHQPGNNAETQQFYFTVQLSGNDVKSSYPVAYFDAQGNRLTDDTERISVVDGKINVSIKQDEKVYITGLAEDITYKVVENVNQLPEDYLLEYVTKNGEVVINQEPEGSIVLDQIDQIVFGNEYLETAQLTVQKIVEGDYVDVNRVFDFTIDIDGVRQTFSLKHGNSKSFRIPVGASVQVVETNAVNYSTKINGITSGNQTYYEDSMPDADQTVVYSNTYIPQPTSYAFQFPATKNLTGRAFDETTDMAGFRFEIEDNATKTIVSTGTLDFSTITTNDDVHSANINFTDITVTTPGVYRYTVREDIPMEGALPGITYGLERYTLELTVTENETGGLNVSGKLMNSAGTSEVSKAEFHNVYRPNALDVRLTAYKTLSNTTGKNVDLEQFEFILMKDGTELDRVHAKEDGTIIFTTPVTAQGTYHYQIKEVKGDANGITYDTEPIEVTAVIGQRTEGNGELFVESIHYSKQRTITNSVKAFTEDIRVSGTKVLLNRDITEDDRFVFEVVQTNASGDPISAIVETMEVNKGTQPNEAILSWSKQFDKVGTYYYMISEKAGTDEDITYDTSQYFMTVEVDYDINTAEATAEITSVEKVNDGSRVEVESDAINFENEYIPDPVRAMIPFEKTIDDNGMNRGTDGWLNTDTFTILIRQKGANGNYAYLTSRNLTMTQKENTYITEPLRAGTYEYLIEERSGNIPGFIEYDTTKYYVKVIVSPDNEGVLQVTYEVDGKTSPSLDYLEFTNKYDADPVATPLRAHKTFVNNTLIDDVDVTDFEFELKAKGSDTVLQKKSPNAQGNVAFDAISYDTPGEYHYTINEVIKADGINYDETVYEAIVLVYDAGVGNLATRTTYKELNSQDVPTTTVPEFNNTLSITNDATMLIEGTKKLSGRPLVDGEFTFTMSPSDEFGNIPSDLEESQIFTTTNNNGKFSFNTTYHVPGTYYYVIDEVDGPSNVGITYDTSKYLVQVIVDHEADDYSTLVATKTISKLGGTGNTIEFENEYEATPVTPKITAQKTFDNLANNSDVQMTDFEFELINDKGVKQTANAKADGTVEFVLDQINLAMVQASGGEWIGNYTLSEVVKKDGITYDKTTYQVKVSVKDDGKGKLVVTYTEANNKPLVFKNSLSVKEKTKVSISGDKTLTGKPLTKDDFEFTLTPSDENGTVLEGAQTITAKNDAKGKFKFELEYDEKGTYHYVVKETNEGKAGFTYDDTKYLIKVDVTFDKTDHSKLVSSVTINEIGGTGKAIEFENEYKADPVTPKIQARKEFTNTANNSDVKITDFQFELTRPNGVKDKVNAKADGSVEFVLDEVTLDMLDENREWRSTYTLKEVSKNDGIDYDDTVYEVEVVVKDNGKGKLNVEYNVEDDKEILFTNSLSVKEKAKVSISGDKILTGRPLAKDDFTFIMSESDENGVIVEDGEVITSKNDAKGKFTFELEYDETGTYYYVVSEKDTKVAGVTYDDTIYLVKVDITFDQTNHSKLVSEVTVKEIDGEREEIEFHNTYKTTPLEGIELNINKELKGREWKEEDVFEFTLTQINKTFFTNEGNEKTIEVKKDTNNQNIFEGIRFEEGTYVYDLQEVMPENPDKHMKYDDRVYRVVVEVKDDDSILKAKLSVLNGEEKVLETEYSTEVSETVNFINEYQEDEIVDTGDGTNTTMWGGMMMLSIVGMVAAVMFRKRESKQ